MTISARSPDVTERIGEITGPLRDGLTVQYQRVLNRGQQAALAVLLTLILASGSALLWLLAARTTAAGPASETVLAIMIALEAVRVAMGIPAAIFATRARDPIPLRPAGRSDGDLPRVALLTTIVPSKEPIELVRKTLIAMLAVRYEGIKDVYLLDEGDDPACRAMCAELGVRHFTRKGIAKWNTAGGAFKAKTKAGNHNAWRDRHERGYDIVGQADPDHVPFPWFLERSIGYFNDADTGFVVAPQVYGNGHESWIAKGAAQMAYIFEAIVQRGANALGAPILIGTNHLYRITCWRMIGGYQDSITEDHLTGMAVLAATNPRTGNRWRGVYTPDILAIGEGPSTWTDWFAQQMRWAWGMWQIGCKHSPRLLPQLDRRQRLSYLLLQPYYPLVCVQWLLSITLSTAYLVTGAHLRMPVMLWATAWGASMASMFAFFLWTHRFNLTARQRREPGFTGLALMLMTIPVFASAGLRWISRRGLPYVITAKGNLASPDSLRTFRPHLVWACWTGTLLALAGLGVLHPWPVVIFWVAVAFAISTVPPGIYLAGRLRHAPAVPPATEPQRVLVGTASR
ncbi:MAG TPA: glycosyltransferase [Streptosporangiaceae bacterium]|jgi:cellulose synthase/poly-beta-1,6-N-acetylglucosamine synthase-like glycosyltransferase|nr:glycosyltransferase [Streptosporangiaceae bacterium]